MENVEIDLTDEELKIVEFYATQKNISVEDAFKQALFEVVEEAEDAHLLALAEEHMAHFDPSIALSDEDVYRSLGISTDDIKLT